MNFLKKTKNLSGSIFNPCTQMAVCFSVEMKIESKNYGTAVFIYSKFEKKKSDTKALLFVFFIQIARK